jgi:hypothetical protein
MHICNGLYFLVAYYFVVKSLPHLHTVSQSWHFIGRHCHVTFDPRPIWPVTSKYWFLIGQLLWKDKLSHPPQSYLTLLSFWLSYTVSHSWNVRNRVPIFKMSSVSLYMRYLHLWLCIRYLHLSVCETFCPYIQAVLEFKGPPVIYMYREANELCICMNHYFNFWFQTRRRSQAYWLLG